MPGSDTPKHFDLRSLKPTTMEAIKAAMVVHKANGAVEEGDGDGAGAWVQPTMLVYHLAASAPSRTAQRFGWR